MAHKLLLVDRGSGVVARLAEQLSRAGHEALRVAGVVEALNAVERMHPDLVLIDDGGAEVATASLCEKIKGSPAHAGTIVIVLADHVSRVVDEPGGRARRIGCDRIVDNSIAGEALVAICAELLGSRSGVAPAAAAPAKEANRDAPSAEAFGALTESVLGGASALADDGGRDIEAHLDSLFAAAGHAPAAASTSSAPAPEHGSRIASRPVAPPAAAGTLRPARTSTDPVLPRVPAHSPGPPAAPRTAPPHATPPAASSRPAPAPARPAPPPSSHRAAPPTASAPSVSPPPATATVRDAPKALAQLRQPRIATPRQDEPAFRFPLRRVGIGALAVVVGSAAVWFVFFTGGRPEPLAEETAPPVVARAVAPEALPVTPAPDLPTPAPLGDSTGEIDFAAPTVPPESSAAAAKPTAEPPRDSTPVRAPAPSPAPRVAVTATRETPPAPAAAQPERPATTQIPPAAPAAAKPAPAVAAATPPPPPTEKQSVERTAVSTASAAATLSAAPAPADPRPSAPSEPPAPIAVEAPSAPAPAAPVVVPPEVVERVEPAYSPSALKKVDKPVVVLRVLVDEQGRIGRVIVDQGLPGSELEAAAVSAVLRWRFRPGTENGMPVKAWTSARFDFKR